MTAREYGTINGYKVQPIFGFDRSIYAIEYSIITRKSRFYAVVTNIGSIYAIECSKYNNGYNT